MKEKKPIQYKCKLTSCLNFENGECSVAVIPFVNRIVLNSIKCCPYFDIDFEKSFQEYKRQGGTLAAVARMNGKKTESELAEVKKAKRKPREDKGKKRKKETSLEEFME